MPNSLTLPGGVRLPAGFAEDDAVRLVRDLSQRYGWTHLLYDRADIESRLDRPTRRLTAEEWHRVTHTAAWKALPTVAANAIAATDILARVITQAALECQHCGARLTGPPTATWGLCPPCLNSADLTELRGRPCPVAADDRSPHDWQNNACTLCGLPTTTSRPLTMVPAAA